MTTISASSIKRRKRVAADDTTSHASDNYNFHLFSSFNLTRPLGHPATNVNHVIVFLAKILAAFFAAHAGLANHRLR